MSNYYIYEGTFGSVKLTRTFHKWLILFDNGEEVYSKKSYIIGLSKICLQMGKNINVYGETFTHTINQSTREIEMEKCGIDITERLNMELLAEKLNS
jgi:hypothetical protein